MKRFFSTVIFFGLFAIHFNAVAEEPGRSNVHRAAAKGELREGRYVGWIEIADRGERLAVIADFFLESPDDLKEFPKMIGSLRVSLGGYGTHEYWTEIYKNLKYDFDNGTLVFDEPSADTMLVTKIVRAGSRNKIVGTVLVRSASALGSVELLEESDEPDDENNINVTTKPSAPFMPVLDGQYEGECDGRVAALQVQTARGQKALPSGFGIEKHYGISGRLGFKSDPLCGGQVSAGQWCVRTFFEEGSYDPILGKLALKSETSTDQCVRAGDSLTCSFSHFTKPLTCSFKKPSIVTSSPKFYPRRYHLVPSPNEESELPPPNPPENIELSLALGGKFSGYIHSEEKDVYIPLQLAVIPTSTTDNPHNPNQMMITTSGSFFWNEASGSDFVVQRMGSRSFYLRPGFILTADFNDGYLQIQDWKNGFIRGVWRSHQFGRVGTVELIKGTMPKLPAGAKIISPFAGEFEGSLASGQKQWVKFVSSVLPTDVVDQLIVFGGSYQLIRGSTPPRDIKRGLFDPYTGRMSWSISRDQKLIYGTGMMDDVGQAHLFWPPHPVSGVVARDYDFQPFVRK